MIFSFTGGHFAQNTFLVACADGRAAVLVDPGAATPSALAAAKAKGLSVEAILLTHAHFDHIERVALAKRVTGAPVHLHPADRPLWDDAPARAAAFGVPFEMPDTPDADLVAGDALTFGGSEFRVAFAPGHAPGHVIFVSATEPVALVGDVIFQGSIGRTDLAGGDYRALMESIRTQVLVLPHETRLFPGHGPETTVGREARANPFVAPLYAGQFA